MPALPVEVVDALDIENVLVDVERGIWREVEEGKKVGGGMVAEEVSVVDWARTLGTTGGVVMAVKVEREGRQVGNGMTEGMTGGLMEEEEGGKSEEVVDPVTSLTVLPVSRGVPARLGLVVVGVKLV